MSTTVTMEPSGTPEGAGPDRPRTKLGRVVGVSALALVIIGLGVGALTMLGWMVDETHFDRPTQEFDDFERQIESLPGVREVDKARWVEAPTFSNPTSWMSVTVDRAGLPGLLDAACSTDYPDTVTWSIHVRTTSAAAVSMHSAPAALQRMDDPAQCADFGFDAVRLIDELDRVVPGIDVQPAIWDNGRFAVVVIEDGMREPLTELLPLVENAEDLLTAAGLPDHDAIEISSTDLGLVLERGESDRYLALLTELAEDHAVTSYWADPAGAQADGIAKVQIVAPEGHHAAIEQAIRASGLHIAELPVRFIQQ
jgi:hypothetical protein